MNSISNHLIILALFACSFYISLHSYSLTIEEAYSAIPHRRTEFDYNSAKMSLEEKTYLSEVFELTDLATIEKVNMLMWLGSNGQKGEVAKHYSNIISSLYNLNPPSGLDNFHNLIISSIKEQKETLFKWKISSFDYSMIRSESLVRSSSKKLKSAYRILKKQYPGESSYNKRAFFDHLCALDFI